MKKIKLVIPMFLLIIGTFFGFTISTNHPVNAVEAASLPDLPSFQIVVHDQYGTSPVAGVKITVTNSSGVIVGNEPTTNSSGVAFHNLGGSSYPYDTYKVTGNKTNYGPSFIYYIISSGDLQTQYLNMGAPFE